MSISPYLWRSLLFLPVFITNNQTKSRCLQPLTVARSNSFHGLGAFNCVDSWLFAVVTNLKQNKKTNNNNSLSHSALCLLFEQKIAIITITTKNCSGFRICHLTRAVNPFPAFKPKA